MALSSLPMSVDPDTNPHASPSTVAPERRGGEDQADERPARGRAQVVVIILTVVLVVAGIWLAHVLADMRKVQDCLLSGRSNCAPLDVNSSGR
jgi:hypothetical protein